MEQFVKALSQSQSIVVMTGAGMDTESNLPDFRGPMGCGENMIRDD